jgi:hypothetical protein
MQGGQEGGLPELLSGFAERGNAEGQCLLFSDSVIRASFATSHDMSPGVDVEIGHMYSAHAQLASNWRETNAEKQQTRRFVRN